MLLGETVRQCAIYLGHMHYAVPLGHLFTMQTMRIEAHLDRLTIGSSAAEVVMNAQVTEHARRGGRLSAFSVDVDFLVDDTPAGHGMAVAGVLTPDDYARIRWSSDRAPTVGRIPQPLPVLQSAVCVPDDRAVVLGVHPSGDIGRWLLRVIRRIRCCSTIPPTTFRASWCSRRPARARAYGSDGRAPMWNRSNCGSVGSWSWTNRQR